MRDVKSSYVGFPNICKTFSVFCVPRMCAANTHTFYDVQQTRKSFVISFKHLDFISSLSFI